jgi:hypothetical protein
MPQTNPARGRGRPQVGPQISVVLRDDQLDTIDRLAATTGLRRSDTIRHLVDVGLAHVDTPKTPNTPAQ